MFKKHLISIKEKKDINLQSSEFDILFEVFKSRLFGSFVDYDPRFLIDKNYFDLAKLIKGFKENTQVCYMLIESASLSSLKNNINNIQQLVTSAVRVCQQPPIFF